MTMKTMIMIMMVMVVVMVMTKMAVVVTTTSCCLQHDPHPALVPLLCSPLLLSGKLLILSLEMRISF